MGRERLVAVEKMVPLTSCCSPIDAGSESCDPVVGHCGVASAEVKRELGCPVEDTSVGAVVGHVNT